MTFDEGANEALVDIEYPLGWNGRPRDIMIHEMKPPFIVGSGPDESRSYIIRDGKTVGVTLVLYWGGDEWK